MDTLSSAATARAAVRPKSARHAASGANRPLLLPGDDTSAASKQPLTARPRPPSASASMTTATPRRQRHMEQQCVEPRIVSPANREDAIAPQILREEIETQRKVSRQAQRELNALRVQRLQKQQDIELLQRHLRAFEVETYSPPKPKSTTANPKSTAIQPVSTSLNPISRIDQLRDQIRRMDAYKKTLRTMLERLARHLQFMRANMELLEAQHSSAAREWSIFQDKLAQERSLGAELEYKKAAVAQERAVHTQHARQLLDSLREEILSRSLVNSQRIEADKRREEMLKLIEGRPGTAPSPQPSLARSSSVKSLTGTPSPMVKHGSVGRRDSFRMLMEESLHFFGGSTSSQEHAANPTALSSSLVSASSRHLRLIRNSTVNIPNGSAVAALGENLAAAAQREQLFQLYETQYARILTQTQESDLVVVLDRFKSYDETRQRLAQIERELVAEQQALDAKRLACEDHLKQLRLSGIAEVEKRKKIRDFLEQQHHVQAVRKSHAKDEFVKQLKTFSYVQQGLLNITELLKCVDEKFSTPPPPSTAAVALGPPQGPASSASQIDWLQSLAHACRATVKAQPATAPVAFTAEQIARLAQMDATLGGAASVSHESLSIEKSRGPRQSGGESEEEEEEEESSDEEDEVEDRGGIKRSEAETIEQVELLLRTLDSRTQLARQEQSMARLRRAFGLNTVAEEPRPVSSATTTTATATTVTDPARLAAVHAFFREKRQRERQEQRDAAHVKSLVASRDAAAAVAPSASAIMASIMASHRASSAASAALSAFGKPQRKRSNAVSFAAMAPLAGQAAQQQQQSLSASTEAALRRPSKPRPSGTGTSTSTAMVPSRRGSNGTTEPPVSSSSQGARPRTIKKQR